MISIINYRGGNPQSVKYALDSLKIPSKIITTKKELSQANKVILPGVGRAKETIDSLLENDLLEVLAEKVLKEKIYFLGICVGLQILFDHSEEDNFNCLGWVKGKVKQFPKKLVRIPQIGWNKVSFVEPVPIISNIKNESYFYFVNSYYVEPEETSMILAKTFYGFDFCSMIHFNNIFASQFHLEKSSEVGLEMLKNFSNL